MAKVPAMPTTESTGAEKSTHPFQAAVSRVLGLVINSLYSNKEIFLRELISNASDALDKLRFRAITEPALMPSEGLRIRISADRDKKLLTISDNGIGMTREELIQNLGTIAHSGSQEFLAKLEESKKDVSLIGQFGVGFYSGFLVATEVEVVSRAAGASDAFRWTSTANDSFTIEPAARAEAGTDVILHVGDEHAEYLEDWRLRSLVKRFSDYIGHPIELRLAKDEAAFEQVNEASALWQRAPADVTDAQYDEFYKHLTHALEGPLARRHFRIEGTQLFSGLLFLPKAPPFDLFSPDSKHGVRLHVKRVFIMDDCEELLPRWLRFVRGVVDSEDLPLNVSRELLQDSRIVKTIRKQVVKHSLDMIEELAEKPDYAAFWSKFGGVLKEGLHFEVESRDRLAKLCRWESTNGPGLVSLDDYVARMKEGQDAIYYVLGPTRAMVENAPHIEGLKKKGYEVLLMVDAIDQWAVLGLGEYAGKPLKSAMSADLSFDDSKPENEEELDGLVKRMRRVLQDHVSEVRISSRLADSPACLVIPEGGLPPYLERLVRLRDDDLPKQKRVLEINGGHPLVAALRALHEKEGDTDASDFDGFVETLYDQALLAEGSPVEDPARLVRRLTDLMKEAAESRRTSPPAKREGPGEG
jgi:molecular chaperone HtpG